MTIFDKNLLNSILIKAQELKASDVHITSDSSPYVRIFGDIIKLTEFDNISAKEILDTALSIMSKYAQDNFANNLQSDFAYYNPENKVRYRVNVYRNYRGFSMVFRQLNSSIPELEKAEFPEIFKKICMLEKGLVLVCGPTGSGKTTTLATIIDYINRRKKAHIITIEDPIEYVYESKESLIDQREVGKSVRSFADGLKGALREDPDIILIGEMRDQETIKMALTAAETGHLVFGTLHTMSASKTIDRIIDSCDSNEKDVVRSMLSTSLQAIILQSLFKRSNSAGRIAAFEILLGSGAVRNLIRENKIYQIDSIIQTGSKYGMTTMDEYVAKLLEKGLIDKFDVLSKLSKIDEEKYDSKNSGKNPIFDK